jgi:hypothetical protein
MRENIELKVAGKVLTMTIPDITKSLGESGSGKTLLIAKCREQVQDGVTVQVNVWRKPKPKASKK